MQDVYIQYQNSTVRLMVVKYIVSDAGFMSSTEGVMSRACYATVWCKVGDAGFVIIRMVPALRLVMCTESSAWPQHLGKTQTYDGHVNERETRLRAQFCMYAFMYIHICTYTHM